MKKRILVILLAATLMLSLSSCKGENKEITVKVEAPQAAKSGQLVDQGMQERLNQMQKQMPNVPIPPIQLPSQPAPQPAK